MKIKKNIMLAICGILLAQNLHGFPQKPFSPCATDKPQKIIVCNDFRDALCLYSGGAQFTQCNPCTEPLPLENTISQVTIKINKEILEQGKNTELEISTAKPLHISIAAPVGDLIDYILKTDFMNDVDHNFIKTISTTFFKYTTCFFSKKKPEEFYHENRKAIVCALLRAYRNTLGRFGATCEIQITLRPEKLAELIDDTNTPVINFHDIFDEIVLSFNQPTRWRSIGSYYNPVIQII